MKITKCQLLMISPTVRAQMPTSRPITVNISGFDCFMPSRPSTMSVTAPDGFLPMVTPMVAGMTETALTRKAKTASMLL